VLVLVLVLDFLVVLMRDWLGEDEDGCCMKDTGYEYGFMIVMCHEMGDGKKLSSVGLLISTTFDSE
jgi:hypothetical protein